MSPQGFPYRIAVANPNEFAESLQKSCSPILDTLTHYKCILSSYFSNPTINPLVIRDNFYSHAFGNCFRETCSKETVSRVAGQQFDLARRDTRLLEERNEVSCVIG